MNLKIDHDKRGGEVKLEEGRKIRKSDTKR